MLHPRVLGLKPGSLVVAVLRRLVLVRAVALRGRKMKEGRAATSAVFGRCISIAYMLSKAPFSGWIEHGFE
jgi:hypothetical protein